MYKVVNNCEQSQQINAKVWKK